MFVSDIWSLLGSSEAIEKDIMNSKGLLSSPAMNTARLHLDTSPDSSSQSLINDNEINDNESLSSLLDDDGNFDSARLGNSISSEDLKEALFQSQRKRMAKTMQALEKGQMMFQNRAMDVSFNTSLNSLFLLIQI